MNMKMGFALSTVIVLLCVNLVLSHRPLGDEQPLSKINILGTTLALHPHASIVASPLVLGLKGEDTEWIDINLQSPNPSSDDWIGVFSPANFNSSDCHSETDVKDQVPYICSAPIKYMFANTNNSDYTKNGKATLRFLLINQRADFSFALFSGGLSNPKVVAVSNSITFANPKAPLYPRLALGKSWDECETTTTSKNRSLHQTTTTTNAHFEGGVMFVVFEIRSTKLQSPVTELVVFTSSFSI